MSFIEIYTNKFIETNLRQWQDLVGTDVIDDSKKELDNIDAAPDKLFFLTRVIDAAKALFLEHYEDCKKPGCQVEYGYKAAEYFLTQEINRLGIRTDNDQFTLEEQREQSSKIDEMIEYLKTSLADQTDLYERLRDELEDLKKHFILGKKTWRQLALGKFQDMTVSGAVGHGVALAITKGIELLG